MAQITGNQYLNKYGFLPPGSSYSSMLDDVAPGSQYQPSAPSVANGGIQQQQQQQQQQQLPSNIAPRVAIAGQPSQVDPAAFLKTANQQVGLEALMSRQPGTFDAQAAYQAFLEAGGATGLSEDIAGLRTQQNTQQRTLEDLPESILEGAQDVGLSQGQLNRQVGQESRPIIRNISDLLNSVSILQEQRQGLVQGAERTAQFGLQQNQQQQDIFGRELRAATSQRDQLFQGLFGQAQTEQSQQFQSQQAQTLATARESEFSRDLAQNQSQFDTSQANRSRGGGGTGDGTLSQSVLQTADTMAAQYGVGGNDERYSLFVEAAQLFPNYPARQEDYLQRAGLTRPTIRSGGSSGQQTVGGWWANLFSNPVSHRKTPLK